jgi:hypothetical protein
MSRVWYLLATVIVSGGLVVLVMCYQTPTPATCLVLAGLGFGYLMACLMGRSGKVHNSRRHEDD